MAGRKDESVTVRPDRIFGIKTKKLLPQHVYNRRHSHRSSGMTGVRLLDGVHAKGPDGVDRDGSDFEHKSEVFFGKLGTGGVTAK